MNSYVTMEIIKTEDNKIMKLRIFSYVCLAWEPNSLQSGAILPASIISDNSELTDSQNPH